MVSFAVFVLIGFVLLVAISKIFDRYFNDTPTPIYHFRETFNGFLKNREINKLSIMMTVVVLFFTTPFYYEYPNWPISYVATQDQDGDIVKHPFGTFHVPFSNNCFNVWKQDVGVSSAISPVTQNPKVRHIKYQVWAKIEDESLFYQKFPEAKKERHFFLVDNSSGAETIFSESQFFISQRVKYHLFEFNEANSKKISTFYNPISEESQKDFKKLVEGWIKPRLAEEGLSIRCGGFSIPEA